MGKISQVASKYIIHSTITIDGLVDKPDVVGAIFGQIEGLLGAELELRELQRSGRIGRIEVNLDTKSGKTAGNIDIPSSLDKAETAIIAASLEIIQRIGPCNAVLKVTKIEDVRTSKRQYIVSRAKELLKSLTDEGMPDSQELADEVSRAVRIEEITTYGPERIPAGPGIEDSEEIILVEGRADVINLLRHGFKNAIAVNGTQIPISVVELSRRKSVIVFVDGDRGGDIIIQELLATAEVDFITKAPDGMEVEELTKKEIHKCLRARIPAEQVKAELPPTDRNRERSARELHRREDQQERQQNGERTQNDRPTRNQPRERSESRIEPRVDPEINARIERAPVERSVEVEKPRRESRREQLEQRVDEPERLRREPRESRREERKEKSALTQLESEAFKAMLEDLIGTRGAYVLDERLTILGKVPISELVSTVKSLGGVYAVVLDGPIEQDLVQVCERLKTRFLVGMSVSAESATIATISVEQLE